MGILFLLVPPLLLAGEVGELGQLRGPVGPPPPAPRKAFQPSAHALAVPVVARAGALAGKTVYLSPGHGFLYEPAAGAWRTQRGNTNGLVEDFETLEGVTGWLIPYLLAAGADVVAVREADLNSAMVIVDDREPGSYSERGDAAKFRDGPAPAWGRYQAPLRGDQNPFALGKSRLLVTSGLETARVVYQPNLPRGGLYGVYVSYVADASRALDAHYIVHHDGGETHLRVNQQRHGGTWVFLGRFRFHAGRDGFVALANDSSTGASVSADAVRFGGGMGDRADDGCACVSMRPRAEEGAVYYTQFAGAPMSVWGAGDVWARSRMAAWVHDSGEDAVYLAWHSNAFDGTARGTESFIYGVNPPNGSYTPSATPGSDRLGMLVHSALIRALRLDWDPNWADRRLQSAYLGELNPLNNPEMPSLLVEVAFHDQPDDAAALRQPHFRRIVARALVHGIIQYFAERAGEPAVLPPEPPTRVAARTVAPGKLALTWGLAAPDPAGGSPANGYRVYSSDDGLNFDQGQDVVASPFMVDLAPGQLRFFRVAARNAAGVSLPSRVVGALMGLAAHSRALVVIDFDRLDDTSLIAEDDSAFAIGMVQRMFLDRANDGTYARLHGDALAAWPLAFDTAASDAGVMIGDYEFVDWVAGRNNRLDAAPAAQLAAFLSSGGKLFVTGTDFIKAASTNVAMGARLQADDAGAYLAMATSSGIFSGLPTIAFDDGTHGTYDAKLADVLDAAPFASIDLTYAGGAAGVSTERTVALGFPFETIYGRSSRISVIGRVLYHLKVAKDRIPIPMPAGADQGCGCAVGRAAGAPLPLVLLAVLLRVLSPARRRTRSRGR